MIGNHKYIQQWLKEHEIKLMPYFTDQLYTLAETHKKKMI